MFKKILIAEDHQSASISVQHTLNDLNVLLDNRSYVSYCDDALSRLKKAIAEGEPYELLITDLSFENDIPQVLKSGIELIEASKVIQPNLKVLVFSVENRSSVVNKLVNDLGLDAFVPKGRQDAKDLAMAIQKMAVNKTHISPYLKKTMDPNTEYVFNDYDKTVISMLAKGSSQKEIPLYLERHNIKPYSLSSIEKRLNTIKTILDIYSNEQLIAYCKDKKVI